MVGSGLGCKAHVVAMEEISRASGSVGLSYVAHSNLCVNQLRRFGSAKQKRCYLPKLISGEHVGALAMSEPGAGSDVMSMRLRAQRGATASYSMAPRCGSPMARTPTWSSCTRLPKVTRPSRGSRRFWSRKGCTDSGPRRSSTSSACAAPTPASWCSKAARYPPENVLGSIGGGTQVLMSGLDYERIVVAGGPVGLMRACLNVVLPYVHERQQFGKPIGAFQLIQAKIADMYATTNAHRAYLYAIASAADRGQVTRIDAAAGILLASQHATRLALEAIQTLGGNGYINDYPAGRLLRDAKLYGIGAGTTEIRLMLIGRQLFEATA